MPAVVPAEPDDNGQPICEQACAAKGCQGGSPERDLSTRTCRSTSVVNGAESSLRRKPLDSRRTRHFGGPRADAAVVTPARTSTVNCKVEPENDRVAFDATSGAFVRLQGQKRAATPPTLPAEDRLAALRRRVQAKADEERQSDVDTAARDFTERVIRDPTKDPDLRLSLPAEWRKSHGVLDQLVSCLYPNAQREDAPTSPQSLQVVLPGKLTGG